MAICPSRMTRVNGYLLSLRLSMLIVAQKVDQLSSVWRLKWVGLCAIDMFCFFLMHNLYILFVLGGTEGERTPCEGKKDTVVGEAANKTGEAVEKNLPGSPIVESLLALQSGTGLKKHKSIAEEMDEHRKKFGLPTIWDKKTGMYMDSEKKNVKKGFVPYVLCSFFDANLFTLR